MSPQNAKGDLRGVAWDRMQRRGLPPCPSEAGNASGVFNTAQQLGGALGIAMIGTLFFGRANTPGLTSAFTLALPVVAGSFVLCALLCLTLPRTAVTEIPD